MVISAPLQRFVLFMLALSILALPHTVVAGSKTLASGVFEGRSNHVVTGKIAIVQTDKGVELRLADNFSLDNAPDAKLGFGKDGYMPGTIFSVLRHHKGGQTYHLPSTIDLSKYNEVYVWCEKFSVALGVAKLKQVERLTPLGQMSKEPEARRIWRASRLFGGNASRSRKKVVAQHIFRTKT